MSVGSLAKTKMEYWQGLLERYRREHPGPFRIENAVDWAIEQGLADLPIVNPKKLLVRDARRAAREVRIKDAQGHRVRGLLPARVPRIDTNGNMIFEIMYDHIHSMSTDHALLSFDQRDENITKQRRSATRDLQSFLDNNPNGKGRDEQFVFDFLIDKPDKQTVEKIDESPSNLPKPR